MTPNPESLRMENELAWVLNMMAVGGFRHVPIVDDDGRPSRSSPCATSSSASSSSSERRPQPAAAPGKNIAHTREGA